MVTQAERLAALEQRITDHEDRCEERLKDIKATVAETGAKIDKLQWWIIGLICAVAAFFAVQFFTTNHAPVAVSTHVAAGS